MLLKEILPPLIVFGLGLLGFLARKLSKPMRTKIVLASAGVALVAVFMGTVPKLPFLIILLSLLGYHFREEIRRALHRRQGETNK
jgi:hypothetical protein